MASIARRPDGTYRPRYRDQNGKEHARHFKRKADAQRWLDGVTAGLGTGSYVDPRAGRITVGEWADRWSSGQTQLRPTSPKGRLQRHPRALKLQRHEGISAGGCADVVAVGGVRAGAPYADGCRSALSSRAVRRLVRSCTLAKLTSSTASMRLTRSVTVL